MADLSVILAPPGALTTPLSAAANAIIQYERVIPGENGNGDEPGKALAETH